AMAIVVIPFSAPTVKAANVFNSVQTSYLNNEYSGKYLHNSSNSIAASSGTMTTLGNTIKWRITPLNDGTYTIRSLSNTSL
ncbi:MAG: hypothetical protein J6L92_07665, partial [Clostridia bacterium]|nr:hypothetical protein [Clostridia bacterium]